VGGTLHTTIEKVQWDTLH